jgi:hypothetical protein
MAFTNHLETVLAEISPRNPGFMATKNLEAFAADPRGVTL